MTNSTDPRLTTPCLGALSAALLFAAAGCAMEAAPAEIEGAERDLETWTETETETFTQASANVCDTGQEQSPIALKNLTTLPLDLTPPDFFYDPVPLTMENKGKTVQFDYAPGSYVTEGGDDYSLAQFHFHAPSEHTIDGNFFPLEMHLVHVDDNGNPALVVGVMIEEGATNNALATAFANLPDELGEVSAPTGATIDATDLLPSNMTMFSYDGSLTTPPCTEGLSWHVMKHPIEMSSSQINAYESISGLKPTNRPVQSLNSRTVLKSLDLF